MDRGRKAMPVQNKACMARHLKKCQDRHKQKLREMKSSIDNKCPRQCMRSNGKKNALLEDRFAQIETENRLLLEKMSRIVRTKKGTSNRCDSRRSAHSLNKEQRKRELQQITNANRSILRRIQEAQPIYDHLKWADEAKANEKIMLNICEFKTEATRQSMTQNQDSSEYEYDYDYDDFYCEEDKSIAESDDS